jgi:glycosyltransferase involved in cell wall biosynthesis
MPVFNGEPHIEAAIRSLLNQTCGDFTLYISDNCSTDRTEEICRSYAAQDPRIVYSRNLVNIGAAKNYNRVFKLASSPYFRWFNADDVAAPNLHKVCLQVLNGNPDTVLCCGHTQIIDETGQILETYYEKLDLQHAKSDERYLKFWQLVGLTNAIYGLMRRSALASTALMGNGSYMAADTALMAELVLYGKFIVVDEPLFFRRMHPEAYSWIRQDTKRDREFWSAGSRSFVLPHWKSQFANFSGVWRAPIGTSAKLRLSRHLVRKMIWDRSILWEDVRRFARERISFRRRLSEA